MEEYIQNYSLTVMFRGTPCINIFKYGLLLVSELPGVLEKRTPCINTFKFGLPLVSELPGVLEKNLPLFHHFQNGANPLFEITYILHFKYNGPQYRIRER